MKVFFLILILAVAVWVGHKGNLESKKKRIEKKAGSIGADLNFDADGKKEEKR